MFNSFIFSVHNIYTEYSFVYQKGALQVKTHIYDLKFKDADGHEHFMKEYEGKVVLIINLPAEPEYTEQLADLEHLYRKHKEVGFNVLGFPSEDFTRRMPVANLLAGNKEKDAYTPAFPIMETVHVRGKDMHPLFQYLTEGKSALFKNQVKWDYTKFIISREGRVVSRHSPRTPILQLEDEIRQLLSG